MSPIKEPHFFSYEGDPLPDSGPGARPSDWVTDFDGYLDLFARTEPGMAAGEASVSYLYRPATAERIFRRLPHVKLIAILRNPVERAYSAFSYLRERGSEPLSDFTEALAAEDARVRENWTHIWHYKCMGFYGEQLARYFRRFDREQIHVLTLDDFVEDPARQMAAVYAHVGVDPTFVPKTSIVHNVTGEPRWPVLGPLLTPNRVTRRLRPAVVATMGPLVRRVKQRALVKPEVPSAAARALADGYRVDVECLSELLERDLTSWIAAYDGSARATISA
jgi:Sulfotransferase family